VGFVRPSIIEATQTNLSGAHRVSQKDALHSLTAAPGAYSTKPAQTNPPEELDADAEAESPLEFRKRNYPDDWEELSDLPEVQCRNRNPVVNVQDGYVNLSGPEFRAFSVRETDDSVEKLCPEHDFDVP
jgi:hypothetical protein